MAVRNDDNFLVVDWLVIANNTLYTAIDFISQLVLVSLSVLNIQNPSQLMFYPFLNEALPMLDHVAPTICYGYPMPIITCVYRCLFTKINWFSD